MSGELNETWKLPGSSSCISDARSETNLLTEETARLHRHCVTNTVSEATKGNSFRFAN